MAEREAPDESVTSIDMGPARTGQVIAIGGAEDRDPTCQESILAEFVRLSGGKRARVAIIPTASADPTATGNEYRRLFRTFGVKAADVLEVDEREDANQAAAVDALKGAGGVFITGGDQARLVSLLVGTRVMETIRQCSQEGTVVAGTSAGASILAAHMMVPSAIPGLETSNGSPRKSATDLVSGFGLLQDLIIDQHFSQRGRMGRLLEAFAANPGLIGLGIDEDTAAVIDVTGRLTVLGSGAVTIVDGRNTTSDYFDRAPGEIVTVIDSHLFVLGPGRQFDLRTRRPLPLDDGH
jgi:cyanophycinase